MIEEVAPDRIAATVATPASRRQFLASVLATALGISLAEVLGAELEAAPQAQPPNCSRQGDAFVPVREFVSKNKQFAANMTVKSAEKSVATIAGQGYQCRSMKVRYYEGVDLNGAGKWPVNPVLPGPGPTLRVRVGDHVKVTLTNQINPAFFGKTTANDMACNIETTFNPATQTTTPLYPRNRHSPLLPSRQQPDQSPLSRHSRHSGQIRR